MNIGFKIARLELIEGMDDGDTKFIFDLYTFSIIPPTIGNIEDILKRRIESGRINEEIRIKNNFDFDGKLVKTYTRKNNRWMKDE